MGCCVDAHNRVCVSGSKREEGGVCVCVCGLVYRFSRVRLRTLVSQTGVQSHYVQE